MKIILTTEESALLEAAGIELSDEVDYSDDAAFELLDQVYYREVFYAQDSGSSKEARTAADAYAKLADKIQRQIPDD